MIGVAGEGPVLNKWAKLVEATAHRDCVVEVVEGFPAQMPGEALRVNSVLEQGEVGVQKPGRDAPGRSVVSAVCVADGPSRRSALNNL